VQYHLKPARKVPSVPPRLDPISTPEPRTQRAN